MVLDRARVFVVGDGYRNDETDTLAAALVENRLDVAK